MREIERQRYRVREKNIYCEHFIVKGVVKASKTTQEKILISAGE